MMETKKMLEIIEKQYRQANKEYEMKKQAQFKRECAKDFILGASIFLNILIILIIIGR